MFDSVNNPNRAATFVSSSAVNRRKKSSLTINRAIIVGVFGMLFMAASLFSTSSVFSKRVGANSRGLTPPAAGTLTVKMTGVSVAAPTDTFTLRKQVFTGSTNCTTGGGAITDVTGVNAATGTPITLTAADSVLIDGFPQSDRNGQISGFQNPDGIPTTFPGGTKVCVQGFDNAGHNFLAMYNVGVESFAFDTGTNTCTTTPKYFFNAGEKVCVRISGSGGTGGTPWKLSISGGRNNQCNSFFPVTNVTAETQSNTFTLPANNAAIPAGCAGNPTTQISSEWGLRLDDAGNNFRGEKRFRLVDPANPNADLSINKTPTDNAYPNGGGNIHYDINVQNNGADAASNVQVVESVPANTTFVSMASASGPAFACGAPAGGNVTCTAASFPADGFGTLKMNVSYGALAGGTTITNNATISSATTDFFNSNNTASSPVILTAANTPHQCQMVCRADITVPSTSAAGAVVNYSPAFTTVATCTGTVQSLPANNTTFPIGTTSVSEVITNQDGQGSCSFNVTVTDAQRPDLKIVKGHTADFVQGQVAPYTLSVSNVGGVATSGTVTVTEALPIGLTMTALSGTNWTCNLGTQTCTRSDALAPNGVYEPITVTVNVSIYLTGNVTNVATVSGGNQVVTGNDMSSDLTIIKPLGYAPGGAPAPDLTITKTHVGNFMQSDTGKTYTIKVKNSGSAATSGNVSVTDTVPVGLVATAISGPNWNCTQPAGPCARGDVLGAGSSYEDITLTVNVACNAPGIVTNTAQVSGGGDSNAGNNTANDATTVNPGIGPPLTITCPGGITRFTDSGQLGASINPGTPVTSGGCSPVTITGVRSDGKALNALYPIGVTVITWTAKDANNQMATCTQSIAVMVSSGQRRRP